MKKPSAEQSHEERMMEAHERNVRRQLIPPIIFFAAIAAIVLVSAVKHAVSVRNGVVDPSSTALEVDAFTACLGNTVYENTDEYDDSYGDYFYLGADFYETGVEYTRQVGDYLGTVVFDGETEVESYQWTCDEGDATVADLDDLVQEIETAYGNYTLTDGACFWYADEDGNLGDNTDAAWVSCGMDDDGTIIIRGGAE
ncbi:MAG: hypothetical protein LUC41_01370 [Clostridiales bacterium]|nr:hypothetical protein [Clostridiales bacterium]